MSPAKSLGPTLEDHVPNNKLNLIAIGPAGAGKSVGLLHIAQFVKKPVLYISLDGRITSTFRYLEKRAPQLRKRIVPKRFSMSQYEKMSDYLESVDEREIGALFVDPLWSAGAMLIEYSISMRADSSSEDGGTGKKRRGSHRGVIDMPQMDDYKVETRGLNLLLDQGARIPGHFLMAAHYIVTQDTKVEVVDGKQVTTKEEKTQVLVAGQQIAAAIPALFDEVWFIQQQSDGADTSKDPKRMVYMKPSSAKPFLKTSHMDTLPMSLNWTGKLLFDTQVVAGGATVGQTLGLIPVSDEEWNDNNKQP